VFLTSQSNERLDRDAAAAVGAALVLLDANSRLCWHGGIGGLAPPAGDCSPESIEHILTVIDSRWSREPPGITVASLPSSLGSLDVRLSTREQILDWLTGMGVTPKTNGYPSDGLLLEDWLASPSQYCNTGWCPSASASSGPDGIAAPDDGQMAAMTQTTRQVAELTVGYMNSQAPNSTSTEANQAIAAGAAHLFAQLGRLAISPAEPVTFAVNERDMQTSPDPSTMKPIHGTLTVDVLFANGYSCTTRVSNIAASQGRVHLILPQAGSASVSSVICGK